MKILDYIYQNSLVNIDLYVSLSLRELCRCKQTLTHDATLTHECQNNVDF